MRGGIMNGPIRIIACVSVLVLASAAPTFAECGVGNKIWGSNGGLGRKVVAFTTNVWTFKGISTTFEVAGCTAADNWFKKGVDRVTSNARIRHFASQNLDHLAVDMARGAGEHLEVLSSLIELRDQDRAEFRSVAQENFVALFPNDHTTAGEMLASLSRLMGANLVLSVYVES